jgi:predicted deacylase
MKVFNLESKPGEKVFGYIDMFEYPHGTIEKLPVALIEGLKDGPKFLLSGNIHGDELHGLVTLQEVIQELDPNKIKGTIIIFPTLNPGGLLTQTRTPFYAQKDPNRLWPDPKPKDKPKLKYQDPYAENLDEDNFPNIQEVFYTKLYEIFTSVDYYIDLHCHAIQSVPFSYIDRIYYDEKKEGDEILAQEVFDKTKSLVESFGFTIVLEGPPKHYFGEKLHRSTTGSFSNKLRKPGFTVELGGARIVDTNMIKAAKIGVYNTLKWAKMLEGDIEKINNIRVLDEEIWREITIRSKHSGFFVTVVDIGEIVEKNQPIIEIRDVFGKVKDTITAPERGALLAVWDDVKCYPNSEIGVFLIKNDLSVIMPWEYEEKEEKKEEKKG